MEKFAVDLDKVLDEFELNEDRADELAAGRESRPSGYQEFLMAAGENVYSYNECVPIAHSQAQPADQSSRTTEGSMAASSVRYDFPFEPMEKGVNLSQAEFAPALRSTLSSSQKMDLNSNSSSSSVSNNFQPVASFPDLGYQTVNNRVNLKVSNHDASLVSQVYKESSKDQSFVSTNVLEKNNDSIAHYPNPNIDDGDFKSLTTNKISVNGITKLKSSCDGTLECSADRLMKDIEAAMDTGLPLAAFKCESIGASAEPIYSSRRMIQNEFINNCATSEKSVANSCLNNESVDTLSLQQVTETKFIETSQQENLVPLDDDKTEITNHSLSSLNTKQVSPRSTDDFQETSDANSTSNFSVASAVSLQCHNKSKIDTSNDSYSTSDLEVVSSQPSESNVEDDPSKMSEAKEPKPCTPFETPVESPESLVAIKDESKSITGSSSFVELRKPVGFSDNVELSDKELEKYMKESEDNEKLVVPNVSVIEKDATEGTVQQNAKPENDIEGFSSGEEFYSPLLERPPSQAELSKLDPYYNSEILHPDQKYEDVGQSIDGSKRNSSSTSVSVELETDSTAANVTLCDNVCSSTTDLPNSGTRPKIMNEEKNSSDLVAPISGQMVKIKNDVSGHRQLMGKANAEGSEEWLDRRIIHDAINRELAQRSKLTKMHMVKEQQNLEIKNQLQLNTKKSNSSNKTDLNDLSASQTINPDTEEMKLYDTDNGEGVPQSTNVGNISHMTDDGQQIFSSSDSYLQADEHADGDSCAAADAFALSRRQRPTSLNLSGKIDISGSPSQESEQHLEKVELSDSIDTSAVEAVGSHVIESSEEHIPAEECTAQWEPSEFKDSTLSSSTWLEGEVQLGKIAPIWILDTDAPTCMQCNLKFTVLKRRHHCRACGRVLCSQCCRSKAKLPYMDNKEARVCQQCLQSLSKVQAEEHWPHNIASPCTNSLPTSPLTPPNRSPNPNNPNEYCSTIPPLQQVQTNASAPPPTVMVPVGVLKREGSKTRGEPKQVIFSDGIRPGGDLTELDSPGDPKPLYRRQKRIQKKIEKISGMLNPIVVERLTFQVLTDVVINN